MFQNKNLIELLTLLIKIKIKIKIYIVLNKIKKKLAFKVCP